MSYQKQTFENNVTVLTAQMMQHIEDGIVANEQLINSKPSNSEVLKIQNNGTAGQFATSDGNGGVAWVTVKDVSEVGM